MSYSAPALTSPVVLADSYSLPSLSSPVVLGSLEVTAVIAGETLAPTGSLIGFNPLSVIAGETLAPIGTLTGHYAHPVSPWDLDLTGSYTPPVGTVDLNLGGAVTLDRTAVIAGETLAPTGQVSFIFVLPVEIAGETLSPIGAITAVYDPNLLSDVFHATAEDWRESDALRPGWTALHQETPSLCPSQVADWREGQEQAGRLALRWEPSEQLTQNETTAWRTGDRLNQSQQVAWSLPLFFVSSVATDWRDVEGLRSGFAESFRVRLPLLTPESAVDWRTGERLTLHTLTAWREGLLRRHDERDAWRQAGYPGNAPNPGPPVPPPIRWPWGTDLNLRCPLPGTTLRIGRSPCILVAEREIPYRRSYMTVNSAALVRWPDLVPLPCTSMTIETDFDSWCWSLTATLAGPEAWALVQPNPLACEVQATINGQVWRFLLDVPSNSRSFNSNRVTLKGRSRSAWLHNPYTPDRNFSQSEARDMTQLAELAVENTGWTVNWNLPDWTVPAGRFNSFNSPIGLLIRLANVTDDGIYTHPTDQIITLHPRWPVASWLLDGETMDVLIPEAAILSLTQSPVYSQPYNGVYVAGTSHGVLALVKIAGTDGALQPAEPITHELLCDEAGIAARQRGLNLLSDAGAGWEMDAETLFAPQATPAFPLVPPGQIVSIAGMKGISRSCRITAQRSGGALSVRQSIGLERREVESA